MNKTLKYIVLLTFDCFVGKGYAQELKSEVFSLLNLDYPGLEKVKALHQEGKDEDAAKALHPNNNLMPRCLLTGRDRPFAEIISRYCLSSWKTRVSGFPIHAGQAFADAVEFDW